MLTVWHQPQAALALALLLAAAWVWDLAFGEPPGLVHPVVWVGRLAARLEGHVLGPAQGDAPARAMARRYGPQGQFGWGVALALGLPALFGLAAWGLQRGLLASLPQAPLAEQLLWGLAALWWIKSGFAFRALGQAVERVAGPLLRHQQSQAAEQTSGQSASQSARQSAAHPGAAGGGACPHLAQARQGLSWLCSRPAGPLTGEQLAEAAVESAAENLNDSVVGPLFWFALLGLPGLWLYRAVETLDSQVGYRGRREYFGKAAARLDDLLNLPPARLAAALLLLAGLLRGPHGLGRAARGWRCWRADGGRTPSPNGGRPMAAMAGLLGCRLEKPGVYRLGGGFPPPAPQALAQAWGYCALAAWLALGLSVAAFMAQAFVL